MCGAERLRGGVTLRLLFTLACLIATLLAPPLASASPKPRVYLLGIDGLSWTVMGGLIRRGELPHFASLMESGSYIRKFDTMGSTGSPVVWTTVATGRSAVDHGVTDFFEEFEDGTRIPVSAYSRKAKAIWEIATEHGLSSGVIGWWASWPADRINGFMITDHANPALRKQLVEIGHFTASSERLKALERDVYPLDITPIIERNWMKQESFPYRQFQQRSKISRPQLKLLKAAPFNKKKRYSFLKTTYQIDAPLLAISIDLMKERRVDLHMLYLRGPDAIQHHAWDTVEPLKFHNTRRKDLVQDHGIVEGVYRYLDSLLGDLLDALPPDTWLIVASDHGAEPCRNALEPEKEAPCFGPGAHPLSAKGVLFLRGPGVRAGRELTRGDPRDLMPTMAWLLGLPLSKKLVGKPLTEAFSPQFLATHPIRFVDDYGKRTLSDPGERESDVDDLMLERLRNLGYIE